MGATYTAADVKTLLAGAIREVEAGRMEAATGRTISTLAGQLLKALEAQGPESEQAKPGEDVWHGKPVSKLTSEEFTEYLDHYEDEIVEMARGHRIDLLKQSERYGRRVWAAQEKLKALEALAAVGTALTREQEKDLAAVRWFLDQYAKRAAIYTMRPGGFQAPDNLDGFAEMARGELDILEYDEKQGKQLTPEQAERKRMALALLEKYPATGKWRF